MIFIWIIFCLLEIVDWKDLIKTRGQTGINMKPVAKPGFQFRGKTPGKWGFAGKRVVRKFKNVNLKELLENESSDNI